MHIGLEYLATRLLLLSTGASAQAMASAVRRELPFEGTPRGVVINLKVDEEGRRLWNALETPFLLVTSCPRLAYDIVTEEVLPFAKRVTLIIAYWKQEPTLRVVVARPFAGPHSGPYTITYDLALSAQPDSFHPKSNARGEGLYRWLLTFLGRVYPAAGEAAMVGATPGPTGVPFVDAAWPGALLPPAAFGIDEIRVTTVFNPQDAGGRLESVELVFSTPQRVKPPPLPMGLPYELLFAAASPDGVSVELHFNAAGACTLKQIDGAILLNDGSHETLTALPLQWTSRVPALFSGSFDAGEDDADPPFLLVAIRKTMGEFHWILDGLDAVPIQRAELTCDFETANFDFTGQTAEGEEVPVAGIACSDLVLTFKWRFDRRAPIPSVVVLRGVAALEEPTYFRVALVWRVDRWISALEANHSSQTFQGGGPLAALVQRLPEFARPVRLVNDGSVMPQVLRLDEQRRGTENDFNELIGE